MPDNPADPGLDVPPPVTVVETVTVSPEPVPPEPLPSAEPPTTPTAVLDPEVNDSLRALVDDINGINEQIEGTGDGGGVLLLDADQFTAIGFALVLIVCLLAALFIVSLRR